ncbi:hypothetical protein ACHAWO_013686 [Cyclotella atomus]|uniref:Uncharacterized protein n=1 Tax=Cyclotella atomus TaxID=382360 RepID=A0ABD3MWU6_9STRA
MPRLAAIAAIALVSSANAFTAPQTSIQRRTALFAEDEPPSGKFVERGVSMDQDGKSNVWAIEPKMEIENKSSEEKTGGIIAGLAGLGVFGVIAAGVLSNLPDPDQF